MKLLEFFGKSINTDTKSLERKDEKNISDELFWFILDHDKIHKDYAIPLAKKIKDNHKMESLDKQSMVKEFMPMVEKGCKEFYIKRKMNGKLGKLFPKDLREELCDKLYDHFCDDIVHNKYKIEQ